MTDKNKPYFAPEGGSTRDVHLRQQFERSAEREDAYCAPPVVDPVAQQAKLDAVQALTPELREKFAKDAQEIMDEAGIGIYDPAAIDNEREEQLHAALESAEARFASERRIWILVTLVLAMIVLGMLYMLAAP